MRFVVRTSPGVVELNFMWLPTFVGMNTQLKKRIESELAPKLEGQEMSDDVLDAAHDRVVEIICDMHKALPGLRDYLDAVKFVQDQPAPPALESDSRVTLP
jgi:hypothetical protein